MFKINNNNECDISYNKSCSSIQIKVLQSQHSEDTFKLDTSLKKR